MKVEHKKPDFEEISLPKNYYLVKERLKKETSNKKSFSNKLKRWLGVKNGN